VIPQHTDLIEPFEYRQGQSPLLVSMPHSGLALTSQVSESMTDMAKSLPDTDWYLPELYSFLSDYDVTQVTANYSRYVIDLNRPLDDRPLYQSKTTGLFPNILFNGADVFQPNKEPDQNHKLWCKQHIWKPYHAKLAAELKRLKDKFGFVILFDAHSIAPQVPMLFDGVLPDFNFGNNDGKASSNELVAAVAGIVQNTPYSKICNGRFKGGYITRSLGSPELGIHAVQLELSQATYLREVPGVFQLDSAKLNDVQNVLRQIIEVLIAQKRVT